MSFSIRKSQSLSYNSMVPWIQAGIFQLCHLVHPVTCTLLSFSDLQTKHKIPKSLFYSDLHIKHFFATKTSRVTLDMPTEFELLCSRGPSEPHLISSIYKILHANPLLTENSHSYMRKWSHILQQPISLGECRKIWDSISKVSRCVAKKETAYKILMFWYRTTDFLLARKRTPSGHCWRCGLTLGTHYHIFWECSYLSGHRSTTSWKKSLPYPFLSTPNTFF